jgi:ABC-2 type transport system ATP-binding protein
MGEAITVDNVSKEFVSHVTREGVFLSALRKEKKYKQALKGVSFGVERGEIIALLGKNGSGKSTLIKIITGIIYPEKGQTKVMGFDSWNDRLNASRRMGVVLGAHGQLFWNLPPLDTFAYVARIYNVSEKDFKTRLEYFLDALDLREVYKRQVRELSLGEQMKCNFVASMLHLPDVVVLDEPTIGVDLPSKSALRSTILDMNKRYKTTFLLTTHIVEDISIAGRIVMLDSGRVIFDGSRKDLEKFFGDKRKVELTFEKEEKREIVKGLGKIVEFCGTYATLEVDRSVLKTSKFLNLLEKASVADYTVSEPELGGIIERFYASKGKKRVKPRRDI